MKLKNAGILLLAFIVGFAGTVVGLAERDRRQLNEIFPEHPQYVIVDGQTTLNCMVDTPYAIVNANEQSTFLELSNKGDYYFLLPANTKYKITFVCPVQSMYAGTIGYTIEGRSVNP